MVRFFALYSLLAFACQAALGEQPSQANGSSYLFTLNGKPFTPQVISLRADTAHPQPGDLIRVRSLLLTLGTEKICRFLTTPDEDGRLLLRLDNGTNRVIGACIESTYRNDKKLVFNSMANLSDAEIKGLWGVYIDEWPEGIEEKLTHVDPARACITITDMYGSKRSDQGKMPSLPKEIQYLNIDEHSNRGIRDYQGLRNMAQLRFLSINAITADRFDARLIAQNTSLRYLQLGIGKIIHPEALAQLRSVEVLNLSWIGNLTTVEFAAKMPNLKLLDVSITQVGDLKPLSGLDKLEAIYAQECPVQQLPVGLMPALGALEIHSAKATEAEVEAFAKLHPKCVVLFRRDKALRDAVAKATRLRIRSGVPYSPNPDKAATLFEVTDPAKVQEFVRQIEINDAESRGPGCNCDGDPTFEFYENDQLITSVGFKHERSLYWPGHWRGDGMLSEQSTKNMFKWFAEHGFDYAKRMEEVNQAREIQRRKLDQEYEAKVKREAHQAFTSCYPQAARKWFDEMIPSGDNTARARVAANIAKAVDNPVELVVATCRALGNEKKRWVPEDCVLAVQAVEMVAGNNFVKAAEKLRGDKEGEIGAAQLFFYEGFLSRIPDSQQADLAIHYTRVCFSEYDNEDSYNHVILCIGQIKDPKATDFLRQIAHGKVHPKFPIDAHGIRFSQITAYLALAGQGCIDITSEIEELLAKEDNEYIQTRFKIALALLGAPKYLNEELIDSFQLDYSFAAMQAIERFDGRVGMDQLIKAVGLFDHYSSWDEEFKRRGFDGPWTAHIYRGVSCEAVLTVERITGRRWCKGLPNERPEAYAKEVQKWWREHGVEFVNARRAEHARRVGMPIAGADNQTTPDILNASADEISSLIKLLKNADPMVCGEAAGCLGGIREKAAAAIPELIALLGDHRPATPRRALAFRDLSSCASNALAKIGKPAVPSLIRVLNESRDPTVRRAAVESLGGMISPPRESPTSLIKSLHDPDASVRIAAVRASGNMGHQAVEAVAPLIGLSQTDSLEGIRIESLVTAVLLDSEGSHAVAGCIAALKDKSPNVRGQAARLLGKYGARATPAVAALTAALDDKQARDRWDECDSSRTLPVRCDVAETLGKLGRAAAASLSRLRMMLDEEKDLESLAMAAQAVLQIDPQDKKALPSLIKIIENDRTKMTGKTEATVIIELGSQDNKASPKLTEITEDEKAWPIGKAAGLNALKTLGPAAAQAAPAIKKAMRDNCLEIREKAFEALAAVIGTDAVPALMDQIRWEKSIGGKKRASEKDSDSDYSDDYDACLTIASLLGKMGDEAAPAVPLFASLLDVPWGDSGWHDSMSCSYDQKMLACLGAMGPAAKDAVPKIIQLLSKDKVVSDCQRRLAAAKALGRIGPAAAAALPKLRQLAADDSEEEVRQAARDAARRIAPQTGP